jgi:hypothetical protein
VAYEKGETYLTHMFLLLLTSKVRISIGSLPTPLCSCHLFGVRQKYLTIWQHNCEWISWRGKFVLERPSSETQNIAFATERWSIEHRAFAVETYFKKKKTTILSLGLSRYFVYTSIFFGMTVSLVTTLYCCG